MYIGFKRKIGAKTFGRAGPSVLKEETMGIQVAMLTTALTHTLRSCLISSHNSFPAFFLFLKGERVQGGTKFKTVGRFKRIWREIEFKVMNGKKRSRLGSCEDN